MRELTQSTIDQNYRGLDGASNPQPLATHLPRFIFFSTFPHHLLSLPRVRSKSGQTADRGLIFVTAKGLYVTFQSFSEPKLSSLFQHLRYLLPPLALNRLRDAGEHLLVVALPARAALLSLSFFRISSCAAAHSVSPMSITHTEEPVVFTTDITRHRAWPVSKRVIVGKEGVKAAVPQCPPAGQSAQQYTAVRKIGSQIILVVDTAPVSTAIDGIAANGPRHTGES